MTSPSSATRLKTIGVIGSGTMGAGIAQLAALKDFSTVLYDIDIEVLDRAMGRIRASVADGVKRGKLTDADTARLKERLVLTTELKTVAQADLIIEAIPEVMDMKLQLFRDLDALAPAATLLASNTSSLSITALGGVTQRPTQVAGLHFFNPVPMMKLVEVIRGQRTADETVAELTAFSKALGKTPVHAKDTPGFIVNRIARPFYGEALKLLGEQVGDPATIDTVMREAGGFRMGPFELMDLIGIDVNFAVTQSVYNACFQEPRYRPHPIQERMVAAGLLGRKTREGFYRYD